MKYILALMIFFSIFIIGCAQQVIVIEINDFESCVSAGNPVMESYPRQCNAEGQTFVEKIDELVEESFCGASTQESCASHAECVKGGCSGHICQSNNREPVYTTCEYRDCFDADKYGLSCNCVENKCQWA